MKKVFILFAVILGLHLTTSAQKTNLVFFSDQGEKFYVVLNGVLQNQAAETNVKVTDLISPSYKLRIIFADSTQATLDKTLMFNQGTETTFNIKKNNKGEYVVRYLNEVPIAQAPVSGAGQSVIVFAASGPSAPTAVTTTSVSTTQTTTSAGTGVSADGASMGIHMNDPASGVNINMNLNAGGTMPGNTTTSSSYSTTTTTTTTTSGNIGQPMQAPQPTFVLQGYNGPFGCPYPMSPEDFASAKQSISSKSFEDSKLAIAKQVFMSNCMLSSQVREIMKLFSFEDSKLDFAKFAYGLTFDPGNYFKVNDAFSFESTIDDLNEYITGYKK